MKQVILTGDLIGVVRDAVVELLRQHCYDRRVPVYQARALTDAFDITPRDIGFPFDTWEAYYQHAEAVLWPQPGVPADFSAPPAPGAPGPSPFYD